MSTENVKSLRSMIAEASRKVSEHEASAKAYRSEIQILEQAISKMENNASKPVSKKRGRPRKESGDNTVATAAVSKKQTRKKRVKNDKPLHKLVCEILSSNENGMALKEIVKACRTAGYVSETKGNFGQIVYQNLYKLMKSENNTVVREAKLYKLSQSSAA